VLPGAGAGGAQVQVPQGHEQDLVHDLHGRRHPTGANTFYVIFFLRNVRDDFPIRLVACILVHDQHGRRHVVGGKKIMRQFDKKNGCVYSCVCLTQGLFVFKLNQSLPPSLPLSLSLTPRPAPALSSPLQSGARGVGRGLLAIARARAVCQGCRHRQRLVPLHHDPGAR